MIFKIIIRKILLSLIFILDLIIPKNKLLLLLNSDPDFSHNALAFYLYLVKNNFHKKYKIVWALHSNKSIYFLNSYTKKKLSIKINSIKFYKKKSLIGIYIYLRSKYVFYTHGIYKGVKIPKNKTVCNLWHGMPMKNVGLQHNTSISEIEKFTFIFINSEYFINIFKKTFFIEKNQIKITGQPIIELFDKKKNDHFMERYFDIFNINQLFIWMPTWRVSDKKDFLNNSDISNQSDISNEIDIFPLIKNTFELFTIDNLLKDKNNYLMVKIHSFNKGMMIDQSKLTNIIILDEDLLQKKNLNIYEILPYSDVLISDYSSIVIDYLLLRKPIVSVINPDENYKRKINKEIFNDIFLDSNQIYDFEKLKKLFSSNLAISIIPENIIDKYNFYKKETSKNIIDTLNL